jgi:hypothetical protein
MSEPTSRLPARPSLEQLRKQAKELLRDFHAGVDASVQRFRAIEPRFGDPDSSQKVTLAHAQFILAREYGFESWGKLAHHVQTTTSPALCEYERVAKELAEAYTSGDSTAVREINSTYATSYVWDWERTRMQERLPTWFASASRTMDVARADARRLVAQQSGFDSWEELARNIASTPVNSLSGRTTPATARAFYRVEEEKRTIETHGPVSDDDWDTVFAVMKDMALTGIKAGGQMTDAALARLARLEHVTLLDIGGSRQVTDAGLAHIAGLSRLRELSLGGTDSAITDRGLQVLQNLPELRAFHMGWHQRVSDAGIANLSHCDHLETVGLMGTPTGDGAITALGGKEQLRRLRTGYRVTESGLAALHQIPSFKNWRGGETTFALMGAEVGPTLLLLPQRPFVTRGLNVLAGLDGLFGLNLFTMGESGGRAMTGRGIEPLSGLANLGWLACDPRDDAMKPIAALPRLRMLSCQDTRAGDDAFVDLSRSRSLEYIWGRDTRNLTGRGLAALSAMPSLRGLATNLKHVDDAGLSALPQFPSLRELMPMGMKDDGFRHVGQCEQLEALWLMYCPDTGDTATEQIAGLRALKSYYAGGTRITDRSLDLLGTMHSLEAVSLSDCLKVTDAGIAALAGLPHLRKLTLEALPGVSRASLRAFSARVEVSYGW